MEVLLHKISFASERRFIILQNVKQFLDILQSINPPFLNFAKL